MKKITFILLVFMGAIVTSSCKKETATTPAVDQRDKFVGTWNGNARVQIPDLSIDQTDVCTLAIVKSTTNSNQILIDGEAANVNGNSYTYVEFTITEQDPTLGTIVETVNGVGTLNGSNLSESGTIKTVVQGSIVNGSWTTNTVKQ